jgi:hypothetical protein
MDTRDGQTISRKIVTVQHELDLEGWRKAADLEIL